LVVNEILSLEEVGGVSNEEQFLAIVRAAIAAKSIPKKTLARKCKVSRPYFSEMIHGDRVMPPEVRDRLIKELGLSQAVTEELVCSLGLALGEDCRRRSVTGD
jgi:plasmid maintenance system antidote protein VapI